MAYLVTISRDQVMAMLAYFLTSLAYETTRFDDVTNWSRRRKKASRLPTVIGRRNPNETKRFLLYGNTQHIQAGCWIRADK